MMTRPQCSVCLEKAIRFAKQFTYYEHLKQEAEFLAKEEDLPMLSKWLDSIRVFVNNYECDGLVNRVRQMPSLEKIIEVSQRRKTKLSPALRSHLSNFVSSAESLRALCEEKHKETKGVYRDLPDAIANETAAKLLYRAVRGGYLDPFFQPEKSTSIKQLKLIAYAVGTMLSLKHRERWVVFEKLWNLGNKGRLGCVDLPTRHMEQFDDVMSLYPEVDFNELAVPDFSLRFTSSATDEQVKLLHKSLLKAGYIAKDTTLSQFRGMYGRSTKRLPVVWLRDQSSLAYFVYLAYFKENRNVWMIAAGSFIVNDNTPSRSAMQAFLNRIRREGRLEGYNEELYDIVGKCLKAQ